MNIQRYAMTYAAFTVGLMALIFVVQRLFDFDLANGGMVFLPPLAAGMIEGQRFARANRRAPEGSEMWKFSRMAGLASLALGMVLIVPLAFLLPQVRALMAVQLGAGILMGGLLLQALLSFVVTRFSLAMGARAEANNRNKR